MPHFLRETFPVGLLACNCTLLADPSTGEAIVIDPGLDAPHPSSSRSGATQAWSQAASHTLLDRLRAHNLRLTQILITHAHIDHIGGALALKQATGAPIFLHQADLPLLAMMGEQANWLGIAPPPVALPDASADDGILIGLSSLPGYVLHTPGHTQGSICLHFPNALPDRGLLLAGDTLFAGSIGRTDLPGGDGRQILRSIYDRLLPLPDTTLVLPGHGPETSLARERDSNPFLRGLSYKHC